MLWSLDVYFSKKGEENCTLIVQLLDCNHAMTITDHVHVKLSGKKFQIQTLPSEVLG